MSNLCKRDGLAILAVLIAYGCNGSPRQDVVRRDSAGVTIVENPAVRTDALPWRVDSVPDVTIGAVEGDEPYQLFRVNGAAQLADGRIVVVNAGTQELRFFDGGGIFLASVGGRGDGPGEYGFPQLMPTVGRDTLWILDWGRRLVLLDTDGQLLETIAPVPMVAFPVGVLAGRLVAGTGSARAGRDTPEGMMSNDITYEIITLSPEVRDTIGQFPGIGIFLWKQSGRVGFTPVPFDVGPSAAVGEERVYVTSRRDPQVFAFDAAGELKEVIRMLQPAEPLSPSEFDRVVAKRVAQAKDQEEAAELRRRYDRMPRPATIPFFQGLLIDAQGNVWLERYRADDQERPEWLVLDPAGEVLGRIATPAGATIAQIGADYILGTRRGPSDVEQVVRYRLRRE